MSQPWSPNSSDLGNTGPLTYGNRSSNMTKGMSSSSEPPLACHSQGSVPPPQPHLRSISWWIFYCTKDVQGWGSLITVGFENSSVCLHCCLHTANSTPTPWDKTSFFFPLCMACRIGVVEDDRDQSLFAALLPSSTRRCFDLGLPQQGCPMPHASCGWLG